MLRDTFNKIRKYPYKTRMKDAIINTPLEVAIGAVAVSAAFGVASFHMENAKRGQIPLAFSEISQTVLQHETLGGGTVPPLTRFYSATNDVVMQVFEANNIARNTWRNAEDRFAYELEKKIEPTMRIHTLISDYAPQMADMAAAARQSLRPMTEAANDLQPIVTALDRAWDEHHRDVYRTEYYQEQECTGTGESERCSLVTKSREVYDYTIHSYTYDRGQGRLAASLLRDFMREHPDIRIDERLLRVTETNAENEWAMRESRRRLPGYEDLTQEDYLRLTNTWADGSNYTVLTPQIITAHGNLVREGGAWISAEPRARSERYRTSRRNDDGPQEFRTAEAALEYAVSLRRDVARLDGGIAYAGEQVPVLNQKIIQYVNAVLHGGEGNPNRLRREIMDLSRDIYSRNYAGGFDTRPAKWGWVVLWAVLGLGVGGGLGVGADKLITNLYQRAGRERPRPRWQKRAPSV